MKNYLPYIGALIIAVLMTSACAPDSLLVTQNGKIRSYTVTRGWDNHTEIEFTNIESNVTGNFTVNGAYDILPLGALIRITTRTFKSGSSELVSISPLERE